MLWLNRLVKHFKRGFFKNPAMLLWQLIWLIPVYVSLFLFCLILSIALLDHKEFFNTWNDLS